MIPAAEHWPRWAFAACVALVLAACEEGPPPAGTTAPDPAPVEPADAPRAATPDAGTPARRDAFVPEVPEPPAEEECAGDGIDPGPALIRRLTRAEYDRTVRDLLGDDSRPARGFAPEEEMLGFDNNAASLQVTPLHAEQFMEAAEALAARAVEDLEALLPCDPGEIGADACARQFVRAFGRRAWRRPLSDAEAERLTALFAVAAESGDEGAFARGARMVIEALLQSPYFLYRIEIGEPVPDRPGLRKLDGFEIASRLSYLIWGSMPDDALLTAADAGELSTADQVAAQARRMMADPKARDGLLAFFDQWLRLDEVRAIDRDPMYFPDWRAGWRTLWYEETRRFLEHLLWSGEATLGDLLAASYTFVNGPLAEFYGIEGVEGPEWVKVALDPARRAGLLTQASVLALTSKPNTTSPVFRGLFVRDRLLCTPLPPPPADLVVVPPDPDPELTTRERYREHSQNEACAGCHRLIDPVGFGFEHFDALGRWRDTENGRPIDATGELLATLDADGPFDGAAELSRRLAASEHVQRCVTRQFFRFAFGRGETPADRCAIEALFRDYAESDQDFLVLVERLVRTDAFRYRRDDAWEATP